MGKQTIKRGIYNEIKILSLSPTIQKQVNNLFKEASTSKKVDEHGSWEFGLEFDNKGRGYAINWDLYAIGRDCHSHRLMIVIQIRKFERRYKNGFGNVSKSYFLIGRNEDNTTFAHCVESRVIHNAISKGKDVIKAVQDWIFQADYSKVIRQGDIALVPVIRITGQKIAKSEVMIENSHLLSADEISVNGNMYAKNPSMKHIPGTHPSVEGNGWFKIMVGTRAMHHNFAAPTID